MSTDSGLLEKIPEIALADIDVDVSVFDGVKEGEEITMDDGRRFLIKKIEQESDVRGHKKVDRMTLDFGEGDERSEITLYLKNRQELPNGKIQDSILQSPNVAESLSGKNYSQHAKGMRGLDYLHKGRRFYLSDGTRGRILQADQQSVEGFYANDRKQISHSTFAVSLPKSVRTLDYHEIASQLEGAEDLPEELKQKLVEHFWLSRWMEGLVFSKRFGGIPKAHEAEGFVTKDGTAFVLVGVTRDHLGFIQVNTDRSRRVVVADRDVLQPTTLFGKPLERAMLYKGYLNVELPESSPEEQVDEVQTTVARDVQELVELVDTLEEKGLPKLQKPLLIEPEQRPKEPAKGIWVINKRPMTAEEAEQRGRQESWKREQTIQALRPNDYVFTRTGKAFVITGRNDRGVSFRQVLSAEQTADEASFVTFDQLKDGRVQDEEIDSITLNT